MLLTCLEAAERQLRLKAGKGTNVLLINFGERFGIPMLSGKRARMAIRRFLVARDTTEYFPGVSRTISDLKAFKGEANAT